MGSDEGLAASLSGAKGEVKGLLGPHWPSLLCRL